MINTLNLPTGITPEIFLRDYWQQKPLYIPAALNNFTDPLEPEELAGLACEDDIAARIIIEQANQQWQVQHNPFTESDFTSLPASNWCVLVQDLNKHIRELDLMLDAFSFLPSWRIDDVMVSYAAPNGTVGPHTDQYDVFLLQGMGSRRWQINSSSDDNQLIEGLDLRILKHFVAEKEYVLQTGDMLYLPAGVQHYGVSDEPCMTYSVGFRAPTQLELIGDYIDHLTLKNNAPDELRYTDPALSNTDPCGNITNDALRGIKQLIHHLPDDDSALHQWFGDFITSTHQALSEIPLQPSESCDAFFTILGEGETLYRNPASRFAYIETGQGIDVYIDGCHTHLDGACAELAEVICNHRALPQQMIENWLQDSTCKNMLCAWYEMGLLEFEDD